LNSFLVRVVKGFFKPLDFKLSSGIEKNKIGEYFDSRIQRSIESDITNSKNVQIL